jgi:hypothetical protein
MKKGRKKKEYIEKKRGDYDGQTNEIKNKMEAIDMILNMYPDLKKDKNLIITTILNQKNTVIEDPNEKSVIEFTQNDKKYYKSKLGEIFDENVNLVGIWKIEKNEYIFFEEDNIDNYSDKNF